VSIRRHDLTVDSNRLGQQFENAVCRLRLGRLGSADMGAALGTPRIVGQGDDRLVEVCPIVRGALAGLGEPDLEGNVGRGQLDALEQDDGVELPLASFVSISTRLVDTRVMDPNLADLAPR